MKSTMPVIRDRMRGYTVLSFYPQSPYHPTGFFQIKLRRSKPLATVKNPNCIGHPWPDLSPAAGPIGVDDPRLGRYQSSYTGTSVQVSRSASGNLLIGDGEHMQNALIPLFGGDFLQPLYFQRCVQDATTRVFVCAMLSGDTAYTSTYTPIDEAM